MKAVLSIAGSDPSGGAGIQADIKTITAHRLYAEAVITSLTVQNTLGVSLVENIKPRIVALQLDAVFEDITPNAVKVGMVSSSQIIEVIAGRLKTQGAKNIVVDPVMVSTSGSKLISDQAIETLKEKLIPLARVITPNLSEAEVLTGRRIESEEEMKQAACDLLALGPAAVLVKGGHFATRADDVLAVAVGINKFAKGEQEVEDLGLSACGEGRALADDKPSVETETYWFRSARIETKNTHGTGCTLSSALACNLAEGMDLSDAVRKAKNYVTGALLHDPQLGRGNGPLNHMWEY